MLESSSPPIVIYRRRTIKTFLTTPLLHLVQVSKSPLAKRAFIFNKASVNTREYKILV
jgi:hypothetical protein